MCTLLVYKTESETEGQNFELDHCIGASVMNDYGGCVFSLFILLIHEQLPVHMHTHH